MVYPLFLSTPFQPPPLTADHEDQHWCRRARDGGLYAGLPRPHGGEDEEQSPRDEHERYLRCRGEGSAGDAVGDAAGRSIACSLRVGFMTVCYSDLSAFRSDPYMPVSYLEAVLSTYIPPRLCCFLRVKIGERSEPLDYADVGDPF